jgi:DNA-binding GntR family transcriptional regulator
VNGRRRTGSALQDSSGTQTDPRSDSPLVPAIRLGLADSVADRLRETILRGFFGPEDRLREEHLADVLQVSRGPVREALTQLEREGLVVIRRNRGASVARLSAEDLEEVYSLRLVLERLAARYAVARATDEDLAALDRVIADLVAAVDGGMSPQGRVALDTKFHDLFYQASHHRRLIDAWAMLKSQLYLFMLTRRASGMKSDDKIVTKHARILAALRARDEVRLLELVETHIRSSYPSSGKSLPRSSATATVARSRRAIAGVNRGAASETARRTSRRDRSR